MSRITTILAAVALIGTTTLASGAQPSQLERLVTQEMPYYQTGVDVSRLSNAQLSAIYQIMHSRRSTNQKRLLIRSTLGGRNTLWGLFGYGYGPVYGYHRGYARTSRLLWRPVGRSHY